MPRIRFFFAWFTSCAALAGASGCSSGDPVPSGGGSGTASGTTSGTASGTTSGTASGTTSGAASGTTSGTASGTTSGTASGTVSFANDIWKPIFQPSCSAGGSTCHGDPSVTTQAGLKRPYLGPATGTASAATFASILAALAQPSAEDPAMPLVSPGAPTKSFLMYKLDGTQATLNCTAGDYSGMCGLYMPYTSSTILDQPTRDKVRSWISEGAPNN